MSRDALKTSSVEAVIVSFSAVVENVVLKSNDTDPWVSYLLEMLAKKSEKNDYHAGLIAACLCVITSGDLKTALEMELLTGEVVFDSQCKQLHQLTTMSRGKGAKIEVEKISSKIFDQKKLDDFIQTKILKKSFDELKVYSTRHFYDAMPDGGEMIVEYDEYRLHNRYLAGCFLQEVYADNADFFDGFNANKAILKESFTFKETIGADIKRSKATREESRSLMDIKFTEITSQHDNSPLRALLLKLKYREKLYNIRSEHKVEYYGIGFFQSKSNSNAKKLEAVQDMIKDVENALQNDTQQKKSDYGKAANQGELKKLRVELETLITAPSVASETTRLC